MEISSVQPLPHNITTSPEEAISTSSTSSGTSPQDRQIETLRIKNSTNVELSQDAIDASKAENLARKIVNDADEGVVQKLTEFYTGTIKTLREEFGERGVSDFVNNFETVDSFEQLLARRYNDVNQGGFTEFQDIMLQAISGTEAITGMSYAEFWNITDIAGAPTNSDFEIVKLIESGQNNNSSKESEAQSKLPTT